MGAKTNGLSYTVVQANDYLEFVLEVSDLIDQGWQLQGGVSYSIGGGYTQAIVRPPEQFKPTLGI